MEYTLTHADHHHQAMQRHYCRVDCPACSTLTALAVIDGGMHRLFIDMLPLKPEERRLFLEERGFAVLLDTMIPELSL